MTLRLILTRHAKSGWDDPLLDDHSRRLTSRGVGAARAVGSWIAASGYVPDLVLCSSATRTRETSSLILSEVFGDPKVQVLRALYLASPDVMLKTLQASDGASTVLMIAHNPGSALMAAALALDPPLHPHFDKYPTCATTVLEFPHSSWSGVTWGQGRLVDFVVPRDLVEA